jgi:hypothetical protein
MSDRERLESALAATGECLSPATLESFVSVQTPVAGRSGAAHLAHCSRCQAELQLLKSFITSEPLPDEGAAVAWISAELERALPKIKGRQRSGPARVGVASWWWPRAWMGGFGRLALAGMCFAVIFIAAVFLTRPKAPVIIADGRMRDVITRSEQVAGLLPTGDTPVKPSELRWEAVPKATGYKVELTEVDESPLWTTQTLNTSVTLPSIIVARLLPGKTVLWRVTALAGNGNVIATSQIERFRFINPKVNSN